MKHFSVHISSESDWGLVFVLGQRTFSSEDFILMLYALRRRGTGLTFSAAVRSLFTRIFIEEMMTLRSVTSLRDGGAPETILSLTTVRSVAAVPTMKSTPRRIFAFFATSVIASSESLEAPPIVARLEANVVEAGIIDKNFVFMMRQFLANYNEVKQ